MTQKELDAALAVARRALDGIKVMGMAASSFIDNEQLRDVVQDALQAAEDVRKGRDDELRGGHKEGKGM